MRWIAIILVVAGALCLGADGFAHESVAMPDRTGWASPVLGGIAVVSGLLLLATNTRRT